MTENLCSSRSSGEILLYLQNQIDCSLSIAVDFELGSPHSYSNNLERYELLLVSLILVKYTSLFWWIPPFFLNLTAKIMLFALASKCFSDILNILTENISVIKLNKIIIKNDN